MEGASSSDLITAAVVAGLFVAAILLLVYAIRRARRARARQIEEAGEERPSARAKRKKERTLQIEDLVGPEGAAETTEQVPEESVPTPDRPADPEVSPVGEGAQPFERQGATHEPQPATKSERAASQPGYAARPVAAKAPAIPSPAPVKAKVALE